jgi:hypothetical protein
MCAEKSSSFPIQPSADAVPTEAEQLHTGDDPIVDACTGVISALEEIIEELGPPRDSDVSDALELAQGALEEMRVIDAWAVAKAGEAGSASAIPTFSDAEIITLRQQLSAHEAEIARLTQQVEQLKGDVRVALEAKAAFIRRLADGFTHDSEKTE